LRGNLQITMAQKFLYIVPHAIPFPSSEYGGIWNVVAKDNDECFDLISNSYEYEGYEECFGTLRENIIKCDKFALAEDVESVVVESFTT
jgi:hypothetical protein